jgi:predicted CoA-binding protein
MNVDESEFESLLSHYKKFCVYGLSPDSEKPSFYVPEYMRKHGWDIVGIYPRPHNAGNFKIFPSLVHVPKDYRTFVDVFRASERIPEVVDEILKVGGVEVMWLQLGITNAAAEARAEQAGLKVVSNRCLIIEHRKW